MNLLLGGDWDDDHCFTQPLVLEGLQAMEAHTQGLPGHL